MKEQSIKKLRTIQIKQREDDRQRQEVGPRQPVEDQQQEKGSRNFRAHAKLSQAIQAIVFSSNIWMCIFCAVLWRCQSSPNSDALLYLRIQRTRKLISRHSGNKRDTNDKENVYQMMFRSLKSDNDYLYLYQMMFIPARNLKDQGFYGGYSPMILPAFCARFYDIVGSFGQFGGRADCFCYRPLNPSSSCRQKNSRLSCYGQKP